MKFDDNQAFYVFVKSGYLLKTGQNTGLTAHLYLYHLVNDKKQNNTGSMDGQQSIITEIDKACKHGSGKSTLLKLLLKALQPHLQLLLVRLFTCPANLIVMDEQVNGLGLEARELLEAKLVGFDGTLLFGSAHFCTRLSA